MGKDTLIIFVVYTYFEVEFFQPYCLFVCWEYVSKTVPPNEHISADSEFKCMKYVMKFFMKNFQVQNF
jgi:hypothetical protein